LVQTLGFFGLEAIDYLYRQQTHELDRGWSAALEVAMAEHDEVYDDARADRLAGMLRELAERIRELDRAGRLLSGAPELLRRLGDIRTELFHYEVRSTYDTPDIAESRRIVEEAQRPDPLYSDDSEDDEPWRHRPAD
jgi:hypothetical protein